MNSSTTTQAGPGIPQIDAQPSSGASNAFESPEPQSARVRKRSETRERIFEVALREFRTVGVAAAQIDRIAKSEGVARGMFYFHFATKDDVLIELAGRINDRITRRVAVLGDSQPTIHELLSRVNDAIMDEHSRAGEAELLDDMQSLYVRRPVDVQDPGHNVPSLANELARQLRSAVEQGELQSSLPPDQIATLFMASLFGIYTRIPAGEDLRNACEALIELLVNGMRTAD